VSANAWNEDHDIGEIPMSKVLTSFTAGQVPFTASSCFLKVSDKFTYDEANEKLVLNNYATVTIGNVASASAPTQSGDYYGLYADGYHFNFWIYARKDLGGGLYLYSDTPYHISVTDNSSQESYGWVVNWADVAGATDYKVIVNDEYNQQTVGVITPDSDFVYDATQELTDDRVTPTTPYFDYGEGLELNCDLDLKGTLTLGEDLNAAGYANIAGAVTALTLNCPTINLASDLLMKYSAMYSHRIQFQSNVVGDFVVEFQDNQTADDGRTIFQLGKSSRYGFQFLGHGYSTQGTFGRYSQVIPKASSWHLKTYNNGPLCLNAQTHDILFFFGDLGTTSGTYEQKDIMWFDQSTLKGQMYLPMGFSMGATAPTAKVHIGAGSTAAGSAPLKFTSGTVNTAAEAGAIEYDGRFQVVESDASRRFVVQATNATKTTAGAPYTNDGYVTLTINGTAVKVMTTA
jgi:hypothetical protein